MQFSRFLEVSGLGGGGGRSEVRGDSLKPELWTTLHFLLCSEFTSTNISEGFMSVKVLSSPPNNSSGLNLTVADGCF